MKCYCVVLLTMWPRPLTLKLVGIVACGVGNLPINFGVSGTFRSRLIGHLSEASHDLATFTFDLGGHSACCWYRSSSSICVPSLNFIGLLSEDIGHLLCEHYSAWWPFTFEPQNSTSSRVSQCHSRYQVWTLWDHSFLSCAADKETDSTELAWVTIYDNNYLSTLMSTWTSL